MVWIPMIFHRADGCICSAALSEKGCIHDMKNKTKLSLLAKEILTYACAYAIPIIILSVFIYGYFFRAYRENVEQVNVSTVESFVKRVDDNISVMEQIVAQVNAEQYVKQVEFDHTGYQTIEAVKQLKRVKTAQSDILQMGIWFDSEDFIVSSDGTFQLDYFQKIVAKNWTKDGLKQIFEDHNAQIISAEDCAGKEKLLFTFPLRQSSARKSNSMYFLVDVEKLFKEYLVYENSLDNAILWIDGTEQEHQIVYSWNEAEKPEQFLSGLRYDTEPQVCQIDTQTLLGFYNQTVEKDLNFLVLMEKEALFHNVKKTWFNLASIISILLMVGAAFVALMVHVQYRPAKELFDYCDNVSQKNKEKKRNLNFVQNTLESMQEQLEEVKPIVREQVVMDLLNTSVSRDCSIYNNILEQEMNTNHTEFAVLVVETNLPFMDLKTEVKKTAAELQISSYVIEDKLHKQYIIICTRQDLSENDLQKIERELFEKKQDHELTIGQSSIYLKIEDISNCYLEAVTAIKFKFVKGKNCVIPFENIKDASLCHNDKLDRLVTKFMRALTDNETEGMKKYPVQILELMQNEAVSLYQGKRVVNEIIDALLKITRKSTIEGQYLEGFDFTKISNIETMDEVIQLVQEILDFVIVRIDEQKKKEIDAKAEEIRLFVEEKACNDDFSVEMVSDAFAMSYSYLCKLFKDNFNTTVLSYANEYRMQRAMELLQSTDAPIKDIAQQVGYCNAISFNRIFKKRNGVTPQEFRNGKGREDE